MRLKTQSTTVLPILTFGKYTVGDTLVGRTVLKLNYGRLSGWLEIGSRGNAGRKVVHSPTIVFGTCKKFARACHSLQKQTALFIELEHTPPKRRVTDLTTKPPWLLNIEPKCDILSLLAYSTYKQLYRSSRRCAR
jgi:hypothetical protein